MNTYILIYPGFVNFEVVFAAKFLSSKGKVITIALEDKEILSHEGFLYKPHEVISNINKEDVDILIIPGGYPDPILNNSQVNELIKYMDANNRLIAAICAAPIHLAQAGILKDRKYTTTLNTKDYPQIFPIEGFVNEDVVVDGNIITSTGLAYMEFAVEICKKLNLVASEEEAEKVIKHYKNIKG